MSHITDRFYNSRWGVFNHYLYGVQNGAGHPANMGRGTTAWDECADELDVDRLADQLSEVGAKYYFFTLMQGNGFMAAPNSVYDRIAGTVSERPCRRDLPAELAEALAKRDIDLYLYYTGDGPYKNPEIGRKFGFAEPRGKVNMDFVLKWAEVLREYAVRYGDAVKGWWIDGCYREAFGYNDELLRPYYDACKEGNPTALVSLNDGVHKDGAVKNFSGEDFVCGEFNDFTFIPESRFINGAQSHILAPLGKSPDGGEWNAWARPGVKREGAYMRDYVAKVHNAGGVVSIDVVLYRDGSLDPEQRRVLKAING